MFLKNIKSFLSEGESNEIQNISITLDPVNTIVTDSLKRDKMIIRELKSGDAPQITVLLNQLGYTNTDEFIEEKIATLLKDPNEITLVANEDDQVIAFISIHFIPQIALKGDFARISYFCVDKNHRSSGVGKLLEEYCEKVSITRNCDRIEVHCHSRREKAHAFYYRQGYVESPTYLIKLLK